MRLLVLSTDTSHSQSFRNNNKNNHCNNYKANETQTALPHTHTYSTDLHISFITCRYLLGYYTSTVGMGDHVRVQFPVRDTYLGM